MSTNISENVGGTISATSFSGQGLGLINIPRAGLATGTLSQVIINDGVTGALTSEAQLAPVRGGTGQNSSTSTGVAKIAAGTWSFASVIDSDISGTAAINRSKIATGTLSQVIINDGTAGALTSEAQLAPVRGGTGQNSSASTGVAKIAAGTWSFAPIIDSDISNTAAINRTKLAIGTASQVVINGAGGIMSAESQLAPVRGGTGQDFSVIGAGPFVVTISSGTFAAALGYAQPATSNTLVLRDGSGGGTFAGVTTTTVTSPIITSAADITFTPTNGNLFFGSTTQHRTPTTIAGGDVQTRTVNIQTTNATTTALYTLATTSGTKGTVYGVSANICCADSTGGVNTAYFNYKVKANNLTGTVSVSGLLQFGSIVDGSLAANVSVTTSGTSVLFNVIGVASTTINWIGKFDIFTQTF